MGGVRQALVASLQCPKSEHPESRKPGQQMETFVPYSRKSPTTLTCHFLLVVPSGSVAQGQPPEMLHLMVLLVPH